MANTRISDLSVGGAIASTDLFPAVETQGVGPVTKDGDDFAELALDTVAGAAVGSGLVATPVYDDGANTLTFPLVNIDQNQLLGRAAGAGTGAPTVISPAQAQAIILENNVITDAMLRDSAALSVIGNATNSSADPADIIAGTDGHVLRRSGTSVGFGQVPSAGIADEAVALAKMADMATASLLGRNTAGTGVPEVLSASTVLSLLSAADIAIGSWTPTADFNTTGDLSVSYANQTGTYIRIGELVFVSVICTFTPTFTTASGAFYIRGLPFTVDSTGVLFVGGGTVTTMNSAWTWASGVTNPAITFERNTTSLRIRGNGSAINTVSFDHSTLVSGAQANLQLMGVYQRDAP